MTSEVVKRVKRPADSSEKTLKTKHKKKTGTSCKVLLDECHLFFILCLRVLKISGSNFRQIQLVKIFEKERERVHS